MATIRDTVKLYAVRLTGSDKISYYFEPPSSPLFVTLGPVEFHAEYDLDELLSEKEARKAAYQEALNNCRARFEAEERTLLEQIKGVGDE